MRSFLVFIALLLASGFGLILVLGLFGIIDLQYFYIDVIGFTRGTKFSTYQSSRNAFQIRYPANWNIDERILDSKVTIIGRDPANNKTIVTFAIDAVTPPNKFDFDKYVSNEIEKLSKTKDKFSRLDQREDELAKVKSVQLTYTYRADKQDKRARNYWLVAEGKIYVVTLETSSDDPTQAWPILELMASSLRIKTPVTDGLK
jgi:hypothetical protein